MSNGVGDVVTGGLFGPVAGIFSGIFGGGKKKKKTRLCTSSERVLVDDYLLRIYQYNHAEPAEKSAKYQRVADWEKSHKKLLTDIREGACSVVVQDWKPPARPATPAGKLPLATQVATSLRKINVGRLESALGGKAGLALLGVRTGRSPMLQKLKPLPGTRGVIGRSPFQLPRRRERPIALIKVKSKRKPTSSTIYGASPGLTGGFLGRLLPLLTPALTLLLPTTAAPTSRSSATPTVNVNPFLLPPATPAAVPAPTPGLTLSETPGVSSCACGPKKPRKPRKPRSVCYSGRFIERSDGTTKYSKRKVPCRPSRRKLQS